jgi:hypothetical protein
MSNLSQEEMQKRGELIKRARQILIQEFTAMRNQQHQQWLSESAMTWKNKGVLIAYPPAKMFPTEQEVVDKALELFNRAQQPAVSTQTVTPEITATPSTTSTPTDNVESNPILYQDAITPSITEQLQAAYNAPIETNIIDTSGVTKMPPTVPTITKVVQSGGDFVIIHEPIVLDTAEAVIESKEIIVEEPKEELIVEEPKEEPTAKHSLLRSVLSGWLGKEKDKS